jgi:hypothetical protein
MNTASLEMRNAKSFELKTGVLSVPLDSNAFDAINTRTGLMKARLLV